MSTTSSETIDDSAKIALVTGASRGIGKGIAQELARGGFFVAGTATSSDGAKAIDSMLGDSGLGLELRVNEPDSIAAALAELNDKHGAPSVLVNNAGVTRDNLFCLLYTSPSPRDQRGSRMPSSA